MAETTLDQIVIQVARRYGQALEGSASSGTTTTLVDTFSLIQPSRVWVDHFLRFAGGALDGQERHINAYDQTIKTVTFDPAVGSAVAGGAGYQIMPLQRVYLVDAINDAIRAGGHSWMVQKIDDSFKFDGSQQFSLPADLIVLHEIYAGQSGYWWPVTAFEVIGQAGAYKLLFRTRPYEFFPNALPANQLIDMRLVYTALPSIPSAGAGAMGLGELWEREALLFIKEYALYILNRDAVQRSPTGEGVRARVSMMNEAYKEAMRIMKSRYVQQTSNRIRTRGFPKHI